MTEIATKAFVCKMYDCLKRDRCVVSGIGEFRSSLKPQLSMRYSGKRGMVAGGLAEYTIHCNRYKRDESRSTSE